jgi:hypothetical protein
VDESRLQGGTLLEQEEHAERRLKEAIASDTPEGWIRLARAYVHLHDDVRALDAIDRALALDDSHKPAIRLQLAIFERLERWGQLAKAAHAAASVMQDPHERARLFMQSGIAWMRHARAVDPRREANYWQVRAEHLLQALRSFVAGVRGSDRERSRQHLLSFVDLVGELEVARRAAGSTAAPSGPEQEIQEILKLRGVPSLEALVLQALAPASLGEDAHEGSEEGTADAENSESMDPAPADVDEVVTAVSALVRLSLTTGRALGERTLTGLTHVGATVLARWPPNGKDVDREATLDLLFGLAEDCSAASVEAWSSRFEASVRETSWFITAARLQEALKTAEPLVGAGLSGWRRRLRTIYSALRGDASALLRSHPAESRNVGSERVEQALGWLALAQRWMAEQINARDALERVLLLLGSGDSVTAAARGLLPLTRACAAVALLEQGSAGSFSPAVLGLWPELDSSPVKLIGGWLAEMDAETPLQLRLARACIATRLAWLSSAGALRAQDPASSHSQHAAFHQYLVEEGLASTSYWLLADGPCPPDLGTREGSFLLETLDGILRAHGHQRVDAGPKLRHLGDCARQVAARCEHASASRTQFQIADLYLIAARCLDLVGASESAECYQAAGAAIHRAYGKTPLHAWSRLDRAISELADEAAARSQLRAGRLP